MRVQSKAFYADLFSQASRPVLRTRSHPVQVPAAPRPSEDEGRGTQKDNGGIGDSRALVPANDTRAQSATADSQIENLPTGPSGRPSLIRELIGKADVHNLSPREMTDLSLNLYAAGVISFDEYSLLAFQPELHPDFDRTIGALTGETAAPDQRRDFVSIWRERADFQRRHNATRPDLIAQSEHIAQVLGGIETPTDVVV